MSDPSRVVSIIPTLEKESPVAVLLRRIDTTREIRYVTAERLRREKTAARVTVSFLSFIIVCASLLLLVFASQFSSGQITALTVLSVSISFYIIIVNYEFDRKNFDQQIFTVERSTAELRELYSSLKDRDIAKQLGKYKQEYNAILRRYPMPSEPRDFRYALLKKPRLSANRNMGKTWVWWVFLRYHTSHWWLAARWLIVPLLLSGAAGFAMRHGI